MEERTRTKTTLLINDSKQKEKKNPRRTAERFNPREAHARGLLIPWRVGILEEAYVKLNMMKKRKKLNI